MGCGDRVGCGVTVPVSGDAAADGLRVSDTVPATGQQQSRGLTCHRGGVAAGPSCTGWPGAGWGARGSPGGCSQPSSHLLCSGVRWGLQASTAALGNSSQAAQPCHSLLLLGLPRLQTTGDKHSGSAVRCTVIIWLCSVKSQLGAWSNAQETAGLSGRSLDNMSWKFEGTRVFLHCAGACCRFFASSGSPGYCTGWLSVAVCGVDVLVGTLGGPHCAGLGRSRGRSGRRRGWQWQPLQQSLAGGTAVPLLLVLVACENTSALPCRKPCCWLRPGVVCVCMWLWDGETYGYCLMQSAI